MSADNGKRKRPKSYYIKSAKRSRNSKPGSSTWQVLTTGMKGFLLTCNYREKQCVREAYNLLNEYADKMYGPEEGFLKDKKGSNDDSKEEEEEDEEEDVEAALKKELQVMKDQKSTARRFQVVDSGAKNCVFIKTTLDNPVEVVDKIMNDVYDTKECKVREVQRMLPIMQTCKAYEEELRTIIPKFLQPYLDKYPGARPSYCVMFKVRNNNKLGRSQVYEIVGEVLEDCKVDTVNPDIVIIVEVIKAVCCLSVVHDYFKFRKFNMHEIVERTSDKFSGNETEGSGADGQKMSKMSGESVKTEIEEKKCGMEMVKMECGEKGAQSQEECVKKDNEEMGSEELQVRTEEDDESVEKQTQIQGECKNRNCEEKASGELKAEVETDCESRNNMKDKE